jgi:hypothetical protein
MEPVDPPAAAKKLGLDAPAGDHDHARRFAADAEAFRNLFPAAIAYAKIVISWSSPTTPAPLEIYPALAFDQMFRDDAGRGTRSVLDAVLADARDFRRTVSRPDQRRLDEYLESVRDVERRIDRAGRRGELQGWRPALDRPNIPDPPTGCRTTSPSTCGSCATSSSLRSRPIPPASAPSSSTTTTPPSASRISTSMT